MNLLSIERVPAAALLACILAAEAAAQGSGEPLDDGMGANCDAPEEQVNQPADSEPNMPVDVVPKPLCTGLADEQPCWTAVEGRPACHVWNAYASPEHSVAFEGSAECTNGKLSGSGTVKRQWLEDGQLRRRESSGTHVDGKRHGRWVVNFANGTRAEGPYVDGKEHGQWVMIEADGTRKEGPFVDGEITGHWVLNFANGQRAEGPYADGKEHGQWVVNFANGQRDEGPFVDGKKTGHWVLNFPSGQRDEGPLVDGKRHGRWVETFADGTRQEGPYKDGKRHGRWVVIEADGTRRTYDY